MLRLIVLLVCAVLFDCLGARCVAFGCSVSAHCVVLCCFIASLLNALSFDCFVSVRFLVLCLIVPLVRAVLCCV